ncbi:hypothetical protein [Pendulispora albinea]|uniref:Uncharacterized protein n=1 Tax=Pendulispora albinea TaxID=2741071 RepID=A0ABZ2LRL0_9BACT
MKRVVRIEVSGAVLTFPRLCACCGRPPDPELVVWASRTRGVKLVHSRTKTWTFPCCAECARHMNEWYDGSVALRAFLVAGACIAFVVLVAGGIAEALAVAAAAIALGYAARTIARRRAAALMSPQCACAWSPVQYLGWNGTLHAFFIAQHGYATAFVDANAHRDESTPAP